MSCEHWACGTPEESPCPRTAFLLFSGLTGWKGDLGVILVSSDSFVPAGFDFFFVTDILSSDSFG